MKWYLLCVMLSMGACFTITESAPSVVTYLLNGGRFGDNIHSLAQAYWISYAYNIQFNYMPFQHADQLIVSTAYACYDYALFKEGYGIEHMLANYRRTYMQEGYLYIVNYNSGITINWKDQNFKRALKKILMPIREVAMPEFLSNCLAVHVRTGGNFTPDTFAEKQRNPAKFPSFDYYVSAIQSLLAEFSDITDILICTDDVDPKKIVQYMQKELSKLCNRTLVFHCSSDYCDDNLICVIYDFLLLQGAKFLVRPQSTFSLYAELLGDHVGVVQPLKVLSGSPFGRVRSMKYVCEGCAREILIEKDLCY